LPLLPTDKASRILDFGCGIGLCLWALRANGFLNSEGIDSDESQVALAKKRGLNAIHLPDSESYLLERKQHYDVVLMLDVLEHIPKDIQLGILRNLSQSIKPDGKIIVVVPNAASIIGYLFKNIDFTHHAAYSDFMLRFLLLNAGFGTVEVQSHRKVPKFPRPPRRIWRFDNWSVFLRGCFRTITRWIWWQIIVSEFEGNENYVSSLETRLIAIGNK
jgi:2-polyprenyl-3-methyl-5-hydroxy-6-metoxy-1,4-benzoquinol methylase